MYIYKQVENHDYDNSLQTMCRDFRTDRKFIGTAKPKFRYDGSSIIMDGYVYAYNGIGGDARGSGKFKHTALNKQLDELEFPLPGKTFKLGETYAYSTGSFDLSFEAGTLSKVNIWKCEAYIRLRVGHGQIDEWFAGDTNTFDGDDLR